MLYRSVADGACTWWRSMVVSAIKILLPFVSSMRHRCPLVDCQGQSMGGRATPARASPARATVSRATPARASPARATARVAPTFCLELDGLNAFHVLYRTRGSG